MEVLLTTFLAAALAEFGDKSQLLAIALAARYRQIGAVLAGIAVAGLANNMLAAAAGVLINGLITLRSTSLLVAVALLFSGIAGLIRQDDPSAMGSSWRTGAFLTSAACFFLLEFADKSQLLTLALAAQFNSFLLASAGATAGVIAASLPAVLLGTRLQEAVPLKRIRVGLSVLFLLAAFVVAVNALGLT